jgi:competence protein ComEA
MKFISFTRLQQIGIITLSGIALVGSGLLICYGIAQDRQDKEIRFVKNNKVITNVITASNITTSVKTKRQKPETFVQQDDKKININTAGIRELTQLPYIGYVKANRIVEYRKKYGYFNTVEELIKVPGIGKKTLARIRHIITIGTYTEDDKNNLKSKTEDIKMSQDTKKDKSKIININTASITELETLPGIGSKKATWIVEYRTKYGNFNKIEDIMFVRGIGRKTFDKIKELITVDTTKLKMKD